MPLPPLLPGEHEELRLRPAPRAFALAYALALLPAAAGALLFGLASWRRVWNNPNASAPEWQVWNHLWGDDQALAFYVVALLVAAALLDYAVRRRVRAFVLGTVALAILMAGSAVFRALHAPTSVALPLLVSTLSLPALAWVEWRRRTTQYVFTNLRMVVRSTMPRPREAGVRHLDLVDLRAKPGMADVGTLIPVVSRDAAAAQAGGRRGARRDAVRFRGVRPFARVRALVELLVQRASAGDYLRAEQRLDQRIAEARAALQRKA